MSYTLHEAPESKIVPPAIGDRQYLPQSAQNQEPQGTPDFVDGSGPIFSMYMKMATEDDEKMTDNWKADADGILIFTGLFSAAVASLISVSIQDIQQNPQDISNFYLANTYKATIANINQSNISSLLPASPPPFSPPKSAVWVNALWFLSLVISLTCALLATLLQQWARRYLKVTRSRYSPHKRARIRAFFSEGVEKFLVPWAVEILPALLHISLFLFFAGLVVFLRNIDLTISKLVLSWVGLCMGLYGCLTLVPIFRHDSPYYTSLSSFVWLAGLVIRYVVVQVIACFFLPFCLLCQCSTRRYQGLFREFLVRPVQKGMQKRAEETALHSGSTIDTRAFMWTFDCLDEDHELEFFFAGLPGFRNSKVIRDPLPRLTEAEKCKLFGALLDLLNRTFSSDLLLESAQNRRAIICGKAISPADIPDAYRQISYRVMFLRCEGLCTAEFGRILRDWADGIGGDQRAAVAAQAAFNGVVALTKRRNDSWFVLASDALGVPVSVLRDYAAHGDSLSLAIFIHVARQQFNHYQNPDWPRSLFEDVVMGASRFDAQDTLPDLQHEFCALWNQVVLTADINSNSLASYILYPLRYVYITLHQGTASAPTRFSASTEDNYILHNPNSYPLCNVPGHHPGSTPHTHDDSSPTPSTLAVLHDDIAPVSASLVSPDVPSSPISTARHVDESLTDVPRVDDNIHVPTRQTSLGVPAVSKDPITARVISRGTYTPTTSIPSTTEHSASTPTMASTSRPGVVPIQRIPVRHTSPDILDAHSPIAVHDNMLPTESHPSPLAPAAPGPSRPRLSSANDLGAAAGGTGGVEIASHHRRDSLDPPSENIIAALDLSPQLSPPSAVTGVAILGPSLPSLDAERTGAHPPRSSHGRYDIV